MLALAGGKPVADEDIKKCLVALTEANEKGEIVGLAVALIGTPDAPTTQHMAGKFRISTMLGSIVILKDWLLKEQDDDEIHQY